LVLQVVDDLVAERGEFGVQAGVQLAGAVVQQQVVRRTAVVVGQLAVDHIAGIGTGQQVAGDPAAVDIEHLGLVVEFLDVLADRRAKRVCHVDEAAVARVLQQLQDGRIGVRRRPHRFFRHQVDHAVVVEIVAEDAVGMGDALAVDRYQVGILQGQVGRDDRERACRGDVASVEAVDVDLAVEGGVVAEHVAHGDRQCAIRAEAADRDALVEDARHARRDGLLQGAAGPGIDGVGVAGIEGRGQHGRNAVDEGQRGIVRHHGIVQRGLVEAPLRVGQVQGARLRVEGAFVVGRQENIGPAVAVEVGHGHRVRAAGEVGGQIILRG